MRVKKRKRFARLPLVLWQSARPQQRFKWLQTELEKDWPWEYHRTLHFYTESPSHYFPFTSVLIRIYIPGDDDDISPSHTFPPPRSARHPSSSSWCPVLQLCWKETLWESLTIRLMLSAKRKLFQHNISVKYTAQQEILQQQGFIWYEIVGTKGDRKEDSIINEL